MKPDYLRLSEFSSWIGETKAAIRGLLARREVPFDPETADGSQRTYNGADLLAWCLFIQLRRQGMTTRAAAEAIHLSQAVEMFFKADANETSDLHLIAYAIRRKNDERGRFELAGQILGTSEDAASIMKAEAEGYGTPAFNGDIRLGLVSMIVVPIIPCLRRCEETAKAHGFEMRGPDLFEIEG